MNKPSDGTAHKLTKELRAALVDSECIEKWVSLTPLARNEFICWVDNAKTIETRSRRIERTVQDLLKGKKRPCCWAGCIHRTDKPLSKSQKWLIEYKKI